MLASRSQFPLWAINTTLLFLAIFAFIYILFAERRAEGSASLRGGVRGQNMCSLFPRHAILPFNEVATSFSRELSGFYDFCFIYSFISLPCFLNFRPKAPAAFALYYLASNDDLFSSVVLRLPFKMMNIGQAHFFISMLVDYILARAPSMSRIGLYTLIICFRR